MSKLIPNLADYGPTVVRLINIADPPELGPSQPHADVGSQLSSLDDATIFAGRSVVDRDMALCCQSGLWLLHNFLDESHEISQEIQTTSGSYWHAVMHRREPDFGNAKYWFRLVNQHPIFVPLHVSVAGIVNGLDRPSTRLSQLRTKTRWDPFLFVDLCEEAITSNSELQSPCREIAFVEWQLLFDYCYRKATGDE